MNKLITLKIGSNIIMQLLYTIAIKYYNIIFCYYNYMYAKFIFKK